MKLSYRRALLGLLLTATALPTRAADPVTLTFDQPQTAGISGFRAFWDRPVVLAADGVTQVVDKGQFGKGPSAVWRTNAPGALAFDAVHRSLLVRFPEAADKVAAALKENKLAVAKVELVLPFRDSEFWPEGYADPSGMSFLGDLWGRVPPQWHAVAYALRRPWTADAQTGPTFNAFRNGAGYWAKYGAQDTTHDRFPKEFGPAEVSVSNTVGRLDVTALLTDPAFGQTPAARWRTLADCGFLVRKQESYDIRYFTGGYEWGTATGGRGILIGAPQLVVTFANPAKKSETFGKLPPPADMTQVKAGAPTAVMPSAEQINAFAAAKGFHRPAWMPDWQWQRAQELQAAGKAEVYPDTPEAYGKWLDAMLAIQPRRWDGFDAAEKTQLYLLYADTWPEYVRDHWKLYWKAWLMPERDIKELVHSWVEVPKVQEYYAKTRDWRGNTQFYRVYCYGMGTMNFNHTAVAGTLLGGHIIGDARVEADGRHGLDLWPLRTWCWFDGSTQESIDHYYFAISLKDQKMFADFGPTELDRLMGRSILAKSIEELTSCFHPGLRRFISSGGRTGPGELFGIQDGLSHILHTLSPKGALTDLGQMTTVGGMPVYGADAPPGTIARQTLNGPWAPEWTQHMIDDKPLPYSAIMSYKMWGSYGATPLWKVSYQGRHYGLGSIDVASNNETVNLMAQWRRVDKPVEKAVELSTLTCRYGINTVNLLDTVYHGQPNRNPNGSLDTAGGYTATFQHQNRALVFTSPLKGLDYPGCPPAPAEIKSLQTAIGLFQFQDRPTWELYVDGQRVTAYPVAIKAGQRITLQDGVSYVGIIPLPSTDLGRSAEVVITDQTGPEIELQGGGKTKPALLIEQYNYKSDASMPQDRRASDEVDQAYGGFVIELGDATEYRSFAAFQQHFGAAKLDARWDPAKKLMTVAYQSGANLMECAYHPAYTGDWGRRGVPTDQCFPYRKINGAWPYLATDVERDTTLTQISRSGRIAKNGAVLSTKPGQMAYLLTEPTSGTYSAWNPLPDLSLFRLAAPGGFDIQADGLVGLLRVCLDTKQNRVEIDHAWPVGAAPTAADYATALVLQGFAAAPQVRLNGAPPAVPATRLVVDGKPAWVVPLGDRQLPPAEWEQRLRDAQAAQAFFEHHDQASQFVTQWQISPAQPAQSKPPAPDAGWRWTVVPLQPNPDRPLLLADYVSPTAGRVVYAAGQFHSATAQPLYVRFARDAASRVWVNGQETAAGRAAELRAGNNTVELEFAAANPQAQLACRFTSLFDVPLTGVTPAGPARWEPARLREQFGRVVGYQDFSQPASAEQPGQWVLTNPGGRADPQADAGRWVVTRDDLYQHGRGEGLTWAVVPGADCATIRMNQPHAAISYFLPPGSRRTTVVARGLDLHNGSSLGFYARSAGEPNPCGQGLGIEARDGRLRVGLLSASSVTGPYLADLPAIPVGAAAEELRVTVELLAGERFRLELQAGGHQAKYEGQISNPWNVPSVGFARTDLCSVQIANPNQVLRVRELAVIDH